MPRILAIDFGEKRCGIAVTDDLQLIASGLTTIQTNDVVSWLKAYVKKEEVSLFLIGKPKRLHGEDSPLEAIIQGFILALQKEISEIPVQRVDERFTSKMAFDTMIASGISKKKRKDKALVDKISATIILQDYLQYR